MHAQAAADALPMTGTPESRAFAAGQLVEQATGGDLDAFEELVRRFQRLEITRQRGFGVDNNIFVVGQLDDQIGAKPAFFRIGRDLLRKIAIIDHSGHFDHALELAQVKVQVGGGYAQEAFFTRIAAAR